MRVHVALTPAEFLDAPLPGRVALAVDVLRATTASVAACEAGCRRLVPVPDAETAEAMAARDGAGWSEKVILSRSCDSPSPSLSP